MRSIAHLIAVAAVAALLTAGLAPAANATGIPADCTLAPAGADGLRLTCSARPPTQTWHLKILCTYWTTPTSVAGNRVTGNGTSEAHCLLGYEPDGGFFVIDS